MLQNYNLDNIMLLYPMFFVTPCIYYTEPRQPRYWIFGFVASDFIHVSNDFYTPKVLYYDN